MDQKLSISRSEFICLHCGGHAIFILGGYVVGDADAPLVSVEILNTETGELIQGPHMPQVYGLYYGCYREQQTIGADRHHTLYDKDSQIQCGKQLP